MSRHLLRNVIFTTVLSALLVMAMVGMVSAERVANQSVISVTATKTGVVENGLRFFEYSGGPFTMVEMDGIKAPSLGATSSSSRYLYFLVEDKAIFDGPFIAEFTFTYMAPQAGRFRLLYDNNVTGNRYTPTDYIDVKPEDIGKWVKHTFSLKDVMFSNEAAAGTADFRFHTNIPFNVRSLEIKLTPQ